MRRARAICLAVYSETTYRAHPPSSKVVEKPAVRAVSRKDLVAGSTADTHKAVESELGHAKGGVLLVTDAHALLGAGGADKRGGDDYYGKLALEHLVSKVEEEELAAREKKDAPSITEQAARRRSRVVLLLALRGDKVAHVLEAAPALGSLAPTCLEFAAYSAEGAHPAGGRRARLRPRARARRRHRQGRRLGRRAPRRGEARRVPARVLLVGC